MVVEPEHPALASRFAFANDPIVGKAGTRYAGPIALTGHANTEGASATDACSFSADTAYAHSCAATESPTPQGTIALNPKITERFSEHSNAIGLPPDSKILICDP
jgi:hypothetical protein